MLMSACGFHLRGKGQQAAVPQELATMSVRFSDNQIINKPILKILREVLRQQAKIQLVSASETQYPQLILSKEKISSRVLTVSSTTGRVTEMILEYRVSFRLVLDKKELLPSQDIYIQRDYSFDPLNVTAKEREERYLLEQLRYRAAQQILRRLSSLKMSKE
ncbi:MAG: LPS assembly lipoprotein LptE [Gammaproteobacteria bacterium]|nr:MAG: LPS assembly lipoprotein LptE [Gammaproteobacteria bacterium]